MISEQDIPALKLVLNSIKLFPSEMLDDMISDYLINPESEDIWFTATENNIPISVGFCAPEKLTAGTYNLYAIGVKSDIHSKGIGSQMMNFIENYLRNRNHRLLVVDTSGKDEFKLTREFYQKLNYTQEAVIHDFWDEGDDKIVFCKKL